jgi:hexosaminidase
MNVSRLLFFFILFSMAACNPAAVPPKDLTQVALIPKPVSVNAAEGVFEITKETAIYVGGGSEELQRVGALLADKFKTSFGHDYPVTTATSDSLPGSYIYLGISADNKTEGNEGYELAINKTHIKLTGNTAEGVFRGVQTLLQLLPDDFGIKSINGSYAIANGTISDHPVYSFRGSMLDVSRHFFNVDEVKRYIDLLAFYKMNVLHLHLSDDQGWRIEIKSWPKLATRGGETQVGGGKGGYYTQDQYKDIVKYAQDRYITIIPEIDMPGHTNAALASYAELNCSDTARELYTKTEVGFSTLCVKKDITYKFVDDVVRELAAITPGPYIHLGGDESHVTSKEDFIYFINKIQSIPKKYGKRMIGWEEIAQASLDSSTIVQFWSNAEHAKEAVKKGAKIIMSPAKRVYLDMKYDSTTKLGQDWAARIEIDSSYSWSPATLVNGIPNENILGVEAPLWTETINSMNDVEYMVFPRLIGIAEIGWSPEAGRNWDEYKTRLAKHASRMKAMEIDYYESKQVPWNK